MKNHATPTCSLAIFLKNDPLSSHEACIVLQDEKVPMKCFKPRMPQLAQHTRTVLGAQSFKMLECSAKEHLNVNYAATYTWARGMV